MFLVGVFVIGRLITSLGQGREVDFFPKIDLLQTSQIRPIGQEFLEDVLLSELPLERLLTGMREHVTAHQGLGQKLQKITKRRDKRVRNRGAESMAGLIQFRVYCCMETEGGRRGAYVVGHEEEAILFLAEAQCIRSLGQCLCGRQSEHASVWPRHLRVRLGWLSSC